MTPASSVQSSQNIVWLKKIPNADSLGKFGFLPIKPFEKGDSVGLKSSCDTIKFTDQDVKRRRLQ